MCRQPMLKRAVCSKPAGIYGYRELCVHPESRRRNPHILAMQCHSHAHPFPNVRVHRDIKVDRHTNDSSAGSAQQKEKRWFGWGLARESAAAACTTATSCGEGSTTGAPPTPLAWSSSRPSSSCAAALRTPAFSSLHRFLASAVSAFKSCHAHEYQGSADEPLIAQPYP